MQCRARNCYTPSFREVVQLPNYVHVPIRSAKSRQAMWIGGQKWNAERCGIERCLTAADSPRF